ncbi:hypothetical protein [Belliella aquatica]|uniref:6-bladed beta-propeller n=1 Tax=Belliella aquatica TaxID=1323734 RepID=A0ABQ1N6J2_9BACT|nr:hypothetical protein [Belliella aquatica]MCH7407182.1 hypothetical protein [Belliella aquatica]GGC52597.1 hypothetical protein GCM10010993_33850 [Belliella aquatica]
MKKLQMYLLGALIFCSCTRPKEVKQEITTSYSFEVIDSLDLNILGDPLIIDISPKADLVVFYDYANEEFIIADFLGNIVNRFSKKGDNPDSFGFLMELPGFINDNQLALAGMKGIFIYDLEGNMIKKLAHPESLGGAGFMTFSGKGIETVLIDGKQYLLSKSVRTRDTFAGEQKFYDNFRAIELIDIEAEEFIEIVPFEQNSQFLDGNGYFESDYAPAFEAKDEKLYIALGAEQRLNIYSLSSEGAKLDTIVKLTIPGFEKLPITSRSEFSKGTITINGGTPAIRNIHIVDGKILIQYYCGIPEDRMDELEVLWNSGDEEESERLYDQVENEVIQGVLILDQNTLEVIGNLEYPNKVNKSGFASGGGYLWMEKAPNDEEEEDFLRIYKVKLAEK